MTSHRSILHALVGLVVATLACGWSPPALAVPPTSSAVVAHARTRLPAPAWVRATYTGGVKGAAPTIALRILLAPDGRIRQDLQRIHGRVTASAVWAPPSVDPAALPLSVAPAWLRLLAGRDVAQVLKDMKVDLGRTSYAHLDERVVWVVGAGPRQPDAAQIHVERVTGNVRQVTERIGVGEAARSVTVRFDGLNDTTTDATTRWPASVTITGMDAEPVTLRLDAIEVGEPLEADAFVVDRRATAPPTGE